SFNGTIRLGGTIGTHWLLGWEASGWLKNNDTAWPAFGGLDRTLGTSTVVAFYYPGASRFWLKAGAGVSYAGFSCGDPSWIGCPLSLCLPIESAHGTGVALTAGLGYDIGLGRKLSLTPEVSFAAGLPRDMNDNGVLVTRDWSHDVWAVNLCLTFH